MGTTGIRTGITTGTTTDVEGNRRARPGCLVALVFFPGLKVDEYSANRLRCGRWLPNPALIGPPSDSSISPLCPTNALPGLGGIGLNY
jgi:hypothetical protein